MEYPALGIAAHRLVSSRLAGPAVTKLVMADLSAIASVSSSPTAWDAIPFYQWILRFEAAACNPHLKDAFCGMDRGLGKRSPRSLSALSRAWARHGLAGARGRG